MRALKLELTAFGPYREKQLIDFTKLGSEPIFLVTGPTGAGKTTIFDAICYSLYGRASGNDRDQDGFRSHFANASEQTTVSFTFTLHHKEYQVVRSPKQQKPKARGEGYTEEAASASFYLIKDEGKKELIVSKIKEVNETIEEMIGLDYEQFKKMIMIPQGEFRKLISENSKEREEVLQKIFRTYFYKNMTDKLKEEAKVLEEDINKVKWRYEEELNKLPEGSFDREAETKIKEQLDDRYVALEAEKEKEKQALEQVNIELTKLQEQYYEQKKLCEQFEEYEQLTSKQIELDKKEQEIGQIQTQLELSKTAEKIKPIEQLMQTRKQEWETEKSKLDKLRIAQEQKEADYQRVRAQYEEEAQKEAERNALQLKWKEQQQLLEKIDEYETVTKQRNQLHAKLKEKENEEATLLKSINQAEEQKEAYYKLKDKIYESTTLLQQKQVEQDKLQRNAKDMKDLNGAFNELLVLRKDYQQYKSVVKKLERKVKEQQNKCEQLEKERKRHYASQLAGSLMDGDPCPVCGSVHHPNPNTTEDGLVSDDKIEKETNILTALQDESKEMQMKLLQIKEQGEGKKQIVTHLAHSLAINEQQLTRKDLQQQEMNLKEERERNEQSVHTYHKELQVLKEQSKQIEQTLKAYESLKEQLKQVQEVYQNVKEQYHQLQAKHEQLAGQLPEDAETPELFKQKLAQLETQLNHILEQWKQLQTSYEKTMAERNRAVTIYQEAKQFTEQLQQKYAEQEAEMKQALDNYQFASLSDYKNALLPLDRQRELESVLTHHAEEKHVVQNRLSQLKEWIEGKEKPDLTTLQQTIDDVEKQKEEKNKIIQAITFQIEQLVTTIRKTNELEEQMNKINDDYYHIGELANLARGDNTARLSFERFVLSTFLDEILLQANIRLGQMSDHRYQLIRSEELAKRGAQSGLDLEVLDHYTGKKRSVKTLSGGEGFKAALSLALGMSDIVQAHAGGVQLDTLFIDEGFGTLDDVSLEQAIKCLKDLQQDHRIIGVISHVAQLKDEIKAKLVVESSPNGSTAKFKIG
ncbi:AAA family ATPase [Gracilibacillus sp. S3-1-1]|uniref:AAA family ATPase n=1 Tax=Gracilibacillus pellucidus TaxID=3095368 RepID=A0ACC6M5L2_9BACI|nr:AAA family ATPase [Gracilibacillus sp. S3-1-1]MDX8046181.1 AAA family ATPase [Gracilibacillus sp. S3-1-1]